MRHLGAFRRQGLVVEVLRRFRVHRQSELVAPAEVEPRPADRVVPQPRARVALGEVRRVRRDLVGDDAFLDVLAVRQAEMLLRRDVAEHRRAVPADHRRPDGAGDVVVARRRVCDEGAKRVERRLVAFLELLVHVLLDLVHRHVAGAFDHDLDVVFPGDLGQLAQGFQLGELRLVVGVGLTARTQPVAQREADVVLLHQLAHFLEMGVEETFLVMRQAPFRHDRAAAADDAGHPFGGHRHVAQQHAGMDREIVDALLGLLDKRVAEQLPGQVFGDAAGFLQRLIDRYRPDRRRGVADDPLAGGVDVIAGRKIHDRVGAPARRPDHLLDFLGNRGGDRRVADIGVDLDQEVTADRHRLGFRMVDVGGDDGAAFCDFLAHEFRRHHFGDIGAERLAIPLLGASQVFAGGDELHFRCDDAAPGVGHLRDRDPVLCPQGAVLDGKHRTGVLGIVAAVIVFRPNFAAFIFFHIAARADPGVPRSGDTLVDVYTGVAVGIGP